MEFARVPPVSGSSHTLAHSRVLGVIPARLLSSRLPQKPLHPILGRPLIEWVWNRVSGMQCLDEVVIATDSEEVARTCQGFGGRVVMTSAEHPSGTDRVAEVAALREFKHFQVIANLQGDEPLLDEETVRASIAQVREHGYGIGTCAVPIRHESELGDPAVVKVVRGEDGRALYFSRSEVPFARDPGVREQELENAGYLRHVGLYVYSRHALEKWVGLPQARLEQLEKLEQLRPLAAGTTIGVAVVEQAEGGVDTPADVSRIEARLSESGHTFAVETPAQ